MPQETQKVEIIDDKRNGLATASMVLGIIAIIGSWIPFLNIFSIIMGFVGLALGISALIIVLTKKKGSMGKTIAGLILCLITLIIAFNMNNTASKTINESISEINGDNTVEILKNDVDVQFGAYVTDGNQYYETGKVEATVTNKTAETKTYTISIEALDDTGTRIATDTIYANSISAGQTAKYNVFTFGDVSKLKTAKRFNVYKVAKY